jgi:hypothetical protein
MRTLRAAINQLLSFGAMAWLASCLHPSLATAAQASAVSTSNAAVFIINATQGSSSIDCTATMLRLEGRCALVTNKHCVANGVSEVNLTGAEQTRYTQGGFGVFPSRAEIRAGAHPITLKVLARSTIYDLAQLELSPQMKAMFCESGRLVDQKAVLPLKIARPHFYTNVRSIGFANGLPQLKYTGDSPDMTRVIGFEQVSEHEQDVLLTLPDLDIIPGMSGGATLAQNGSIIGINAHYIPLQSTGFAIPLATVHDFLSREGATADQSPSALPNNRLNPTGGNSHADPGTNSHGDPSTHKDDLHALIEPDEGYPLPDRPDTLLLGVSGAQIDGRDDFQLRYQSVKGDPSLNLVTREKSGYPEYSVRKKLLDRLAGTYLFHGSLGYGSHFVFFKENQEGSAWKKILTGSTMFRVSVNADDGLITFQIGGHTLEKPGDLWLGAASASAKDAFIKFKTEFSDDAKTIHLTAIEGAPPFVLTCDNRNYLKLICTNSDTAFSLSLSSTSARIMKFRSSKQFKDQAGQSYVNYLFGSLSWRSIDD